MNIKLSVAIPVLVSTVLLTFSAFQLFYLTADTPRFLSDDAGAYCDEGYKTLDARNLVLFGKSHWNEHDDYPGWMSKSPVTVSINYFFFKYFGVSLKTARLASLPFAFGSLILLFMIALKLYDTKTAILVLLISAFHQVFFFYARLALFEIKMIFFLLAGLYLFIHVEKSQWLIIPALLSWLLAYFCKPTAILLPVSGFIFLILLIKNRFLLKAGTNHRYRLLLLVIVILIVLEYFHEFHYSIYASFEIMGRDFRRPLGAVLDLFTHPFLTKNPVLTGLAVLSSGFLVLDIFTTGKFKKSDFFFFIWMWSGMIFLSSFNYQPIRYYIYFVPPYVILAVRAILLLPDYLRRMQILKYRLFKTGIWVMSGFVTISHASFLYFYPLKSKNDWDLHLVWKFVYFSIGLIILLSILFYLLDRKADRWKSAESWYHRLSAYSWIILFVMILNFIPLGYWISSPEYQLLKFSRRIESLGQHAVIAGDWAPQLCLNTSNPALYTVVWPMNSKSFNFRNLDKLQPDFLVQVVGLNPQIINQFQQKYPGVLVKPCRFEQLYGGRQVCIFELNFNGYLSERDSLIDHKRELEK